MVRKIYLKLGKVLQRPFNNKYWFKLFNRVMIQRFPHKFRIEEFRFINIDDQSNLRWKHWSRVYEYEMALNFINQLKKVDSPVIHNTCWGFHGVHVLFKRELEDRYRNVVNSDIRESRLDNTCTYNLNSKVPKEWRNKFDFVLNISTVEEIYSPHIKIIDNLLEMVSVGGYLIVTFDYPGMQLSEVEKLFSSKIQITGDPITGLNSRVIEPEFKNLRAGLFVLQKI